MRNIAFYANWAQFWDGPLGGCKYNSPTTYLKFLNGVDRIIYGFLLFGVKPNDALNDKPTINPFGGLDFGCTYKSNPHTPYLDDPTFATYMMYPNECFTGTDVSWVEQILDDFFSIQKNHRLSDPDCFEQFRILKTVKPSLEVVASYGGWTWTHDGAEFSDISVRKFHDMTSSQGNRSAFIQSSYEFLTANGFDGVDFDWEYPGQPLGGVSPEDAENDFYNFAQLIKEYREYATNQGNPNFIITIQASGFLSENIVIDSLPGYPGWSMKSDEDYFTWLRSLLQPDIGLTEVNLMTYDYYVALKGGTTLPNAPVFSSTAAGVDHCITKTLSIIQSVASDVVDKFNLGLACYGRTFAGVDLSQAKSLDGTFGLPCSGPAPTLGYGGEEGVVSFYTLNQYLLKDSDQVSAPLEASLNAPINTNSSTQEAIPLLSTSCSSPNLSSSDCSGSYTVKSGDTAYNIAQSLGITLDQLTNCNSGVDLSQLSINQHLKYPPAPPAPPAPANCPEIYKVKSGDTAYNIAQSLGITLDQLTNCNTGIDLSNLSINQPLYYPASTNCSETYIVQQNDTGSEIANKLGISLTELENCNSGINFNDLQPKQPLHYPKSSRPAGCSKSYTIAANDSLYSIGEAKQCLPNRIQACNPDITDWSTIQPGQEIALPDNGNQPICANYYKSIPYDTLDSVANRLGFSTDLIQQCNPTIQNWDCLPTGTQIFYPGSAIRPATCDTPYTVSTEKTLADVSKTLNIAPDIITACNPDRTFSCTSSDSSGCLKQGDTIWYPKDAVQPEGCTGAYLVKSTDTIQSIATALNVQPSAIIDCNPGLNTTQLPAGENITYKPYFDPGAKSFSSAQSATFGTTVAMNPTIGIWISYDSPDSISDKIALAQKSNIGGVMSFTLQQDDYKKDYPIAQRINLQAKNVTNGKMTITKDIVQKLLNFDMIVIQTIMTSGDLGPIDLIQDYLQGLVEQDVIDWIFGDPYC